MNRLEHRYLQLDHTEADLIVGPAKAILLVIVLLGGIFYLGFAIGGNTKYQVGRAAGIQEFSEAIDTAIQEGKRITIPRGNGTVSYKFDKDGNITAFYDGPSLSF